MNFPSQSPTAEDVGGATSLPLDVTDPGLSSAAGVVLTVAVLLYVGGLVGLVVGLAVVGAWLRLSASVAFVFGQVGLLALVPGGEIAPLTLVAVEVGLFVVLFGPLSRTTTPFTATGAGVGTGAVVAGVVWYAFRATSLLVAATTVVVALCVVGYLTHRHQLVRLEPTDG